MEGAIQYAALGSSFFVRLPDYEAQSVNAFRVVILRERIWKEVAIFSISSGYLSLGCTPFHGQDTMKLLNCAAAKVRDDKYHHVEGGELGNNATLDKLEQNSKLRLSSTDALDKIISPYDFICSVAKCSEMHQDCQDASDGEDTKLRKLCHTIRL